MRKSLRSLAVVCLSAAMVAGTATVLPAAPAERYLHVRVEDAAKGESVNVNVPLSMAEKILPTVNKGALHNGHVTINHADLNDVDVRAILDAIRTAPDNEFVTVKEKDQDVRVAKSNGNLIIHVRDNAKGGEKVDVTVPMKVVDALLSTAKQNELDVAAALQALSDEGDALLVTVQDATQHVRVWVDSRNTQD
ncbi:MAG: hypothetical protein WCA00_01320 [Candidatus Acidiferrales bacterium]